MLAQHFCLKRKIISLIGLNKPRHPLTFTLHTAVIQAVALLCFPSWLLFLHRHLVAVVCTALFLKGRLFRKVSENLNHDMSYTNKLIVFPKKKKVQYSNNFFKNQLIRIRKKLSWLRSTIPTLCISYEYKFIVNDNY